MDEANDLALHVRQCGRRYIDLSENIQSVKIWLIILILVLVGDHVLDINSIVARAISHG